MAGSAGLGDRWCSRITAQSTPEARRLSCLHFLHCVFFLSSSCTHCLVALVTSFSKWGPQKPTGVCRSLQLRRIAERSQVFAFACGDALLCVCRRSPHAVYRIRSGADCRPRLAFSGGFKATFFFPSILSLTVVAILFRFLSTPYGLITLVGEALTGVAIPWQSSFTHAMPLIIMMMVWNRIGFYMIIFVAGLRLMPGELYRCIQGGRGLLLGYLEKTDSAIDGTGLLCSVPSSR